MGRVRGLRQRISGINHLFSAAQIEHDAAGLGLVYDIGGTDFQRHRKSDRRGRVGGLLGVGDGAALRLRDAIALERRLQIGRRQIALGRGRRRRWRAAGAFAKKPQRVERAQERLLALQERKARLLLHVESVLRDLMDHAAECDHGLVGCAQHALQFVDVIPTAALAGERRRPGHDVDAGIAGDDLQLVGGVLQRRRNAGVERVLRLDALLHVGQQRLVGGGGKFRNHRAFGFGIIVEQIDRAAGSGDKADARAFRQPPALKRQRCFQQIVERAAIDDTVALAHRQIRGVVAADGAGMRLRGGSRSLRGAGLDREDWLAGGKRPSGGAHEGGRVPDTFDEQHDLFGVRIVDQKINEIGEIEVGLVARRHRIGKAHAALGGALEPELHRSAGLKYAADRSWRDAAQLGVGVGEQFLAIRIGAHAVRAADAQLAGRDKVFQPCAAFA